MWIVGFTFVEVVNLQNERKNPFKGKDGTYKDITLTAVFSLVFFFICGIVVLRSKHDLSNYCASDSPLSINLKSSGNELFKNLTTSQLSDKPLH